MTYSLTREQSNKTHTPHQSIATDPLKTPPPETTDGKRTIQRGNSSTRVRQLEAQIESLTLQNVKLQRTNRLLKVDTDNLIKQTTQPLEQKIRELTLNNVQLQRTTRLLQQDVEQKVTEMEKFKQEQIAQMKNVGPEYEFLVQMVNVLHRQVSLFRPTIRLYISMYYVLTDKLFTGRSVAILPVTRHAVSHYNLSSNPPW